MLQYQPCISAAILTNSLGTTLVAQMTDKAYLVIVATSNLVVIAIP